MSTKNIPLTIFLALFLFISCGKEDDIVTPPGTASSVAELVESPTPPGIPEPIIVERDTSPAEFDIPGNFVCQEIEVDAQGAVGDYRSFNPNSNVIWPGNLLQGNSLTKATPESIDVKRAGGTFTIDLVNGSQGTNRTVPEVTQAEVISAINEIIDDNLGVLAADFTYTERQVRSRQEMAFSLGVDIGTFTTDFDAQMSINTEREYNSFLIDFVQKYYTIAYQPPTSYDEVFDPSVTTDDLAPYVGPDNPPVYISSVTYGRRYYILITSTESVSDMKASIRASYDAALSDVDIDVDAKYVSELSDVQINVFAMGGNAQLAAETFGGDFSKVRAFLTNGGTINTGTPLSYKMETLAAPHQDVGIGITSTFTVPYCRPAFDKVPPGFTHSWFGIFNNEGIGAACAIDSEQDNVILFNQAGTDYAQIIDGEVQGIFQLGDPGDQGRLAGCPIAPAGAAQVLGEQIRIFSRDGLSYVWQLADGTWGAIRGLDLWGVDGQHAFLEDNFGGPAGVGAAFQSRWISPGTTLRSVHFNQAGNRYVVYTGDTYEGPHALEEWGGNTNSIPFAQVGPGIHINTSEQIGASNETGRYEFLFNKAGTAFTIFGAGGFTEVYTIAME